MQAGFLFSNFPQIYYSFDGGINTQVVTDITTRFAVLDIVRTYGSIYYTHYIQDGQRPDVIADIYYKNSTLDWLILMSNQVYDPFFQWPLTYQTFVDFIKKKYGSVPAAYRTVHHYEQITQQSSRTVNGINVPERVVIIDQTAYNNITEAFARRIVSCYDQERNLNDSRKTIKVINEAFIPQILGELATIFS